MERWKAINRGVWTGFLFSPTTNFPLFIHLPTKQLHLTFHPFTTCHSTNYSYLTIMSPLRDDKSTNYQTMTDRHTGRSHTIPYSRTDTAFQRLVEEAKQQVEEARKKAVNLEIGFANSLQRSAKKYCDTNDLETSKIDGRSRFSLNFGAQVPDFEESLYQKFLDAESAAASASGTAVPPTDNNSRAPPTCATGHNTVVDFDPSAMRRQDD